MAQKNEDIRNEAKRRSVKLWMIAEAMNMNDGNFSRKLRHELSQDEKQRIFEIIDKLAAEREA